MSSATLISNRQLGVFPISIGTSLSVEGLANLTPDRDPVFPLGITRLDTLMVNVKTLIRNVESAFSNDELHSLKVEDLVDAVASDMEHLVTAVKSISDDRVNVIFYNCTYQDIVKLKHANLVMPTTPGQQLRSQKTATALGKLLEKAKNGGRSIVSFNMYPDEKGLEGKRVALLTHYPIDLIRYRWFTELLLLESNTGKLKGPDQFHTKLHKKVDGVDLPLNMLTLQVFGDGKMFKPQISALVNEVSEVAKKGKWTYMTTPDKIRFWISRISLQGYIQTLQSMMRD